LTNELSPKTLTTMPILDRYSSQIINTTAQRVAVLASPGSGKTTTLIGRVHHLIGTGVPAAQILVLSHSTATVRELRRRMDSTSTLVTQTRSITTPYAHNANATTKPNLSGMSVKTAHAYALGLVRAHHEIHRTGAPRARVLDDKQTRELLQTAVAQTRIRCRQRTLWPQHSITTRTARLALFDELAQSRNIVLFSKLLAYTHGAKISLKDGTKLHPFRALAPFIRLLKSVTLAYTTIKSAHGYIGFNDMLTKALQVIAHSPSLVTHTHILVDEYQDSGAAQIQLLVALATLPGRHIMVFADPSQAIYGFSGTQYTPLGTVLNGVKTLRLPVSHRLTTQTAALASAVAKHGTRQAIATTHTGPVPQLVVSTDLASQTARVVTDILSLLARSAQPSQIAVLARTRALLQPVEAALLAISINTTRLGVQRDKHNVLKILRLVQLTQRHAQGDHITVDALQNALAIIEIDNVDTARCKLAVRDLVRAARLSSLEGRYRACCDVYMRLKGGVRTDPELRAELTRWQPLCRKFSSALTMRSALQALASDKLVTGTIHAAKGMEWPHVLIVGVADGQIPSYLAKTDAALEEERRNLYVAVSRAQQTLRMYYAPALHARSRQRFEKLSRYLTPAKVRATYARIVD
jgi:DNA helicase II / ATP-dependent DNA helicase PcrA